MSCQQNGDLNCLGIFDFLSRCDRGVASKFDYTLSKHEVLYLGHTRCNRVQTRRVRQESRLMTFTQKLWPKITAPPGGNRKLHVFILWWIAPGRFTIYSSKEVSQVIGPWSELWNSSNPVNIEVWRRIIPRQRRRCRHNSSVQVSYYRQTSGSWSETKLEQLYVSIFPQCHSATSWFTLKQEVLCKSTLHYPTGSKLLTHGHNPDLNSPIY